MLNWDEYGKEELASPPQPPVTDQILLKDQEQKQQERL